MVYIYSINNDTLNKAVVVNKLSKDIRNSTITIALDNINTAGDSIYINFKNSLSANEILVLNDIIHTHDGIPIPKKNLSIISEDKTSTQGIYQIKSVKFSVPANSESQIIIKIPYNIRLLDLEFKANSNGDKTEALLGGDIPINGLTQNTLVDDTIINVSDLVLTNILPGFKIQIQDGIKKHTSIVVSVDILNKTLTLEKAFIDTFKATTSIINIFIPLTYNYLDLQANKEYKCGEKIVGGLLINANTPLTIKYFNNSNNNIDIIFYMEYWF